MTPHLDWVEKPEPFRNEVIVADNRKLLVERRGNVNVTIQIDNTPEIVEVQDVLIVPDLSASLLSVSRIVDKGYTVKFDKNGGEIRNQTTNKLIATAKRTNDMYQLDQPINRANQVTSANDAKLWHRRLGHLNSNSLSMLRNGAASGIVFNGEITEVCKSCSLGKQQRRPFKMSKSTSKHVLQLIHSDVCGPMETKSIGGSRYFLTFVDDYSRKVFIYLLESKEQVFSSFKNFKAFVEKQTGYHIKAIRSDNGGEYVKVQFQTFLRSNGIEHQTSVPYSPQQNGVAERANRTVCERARCMIADAHLSKGYWAEGVSTAAYLINRSPAKALNGKTPEELWTGKKPDLSHIRVFGSKAMTHIPKEKRRKWDPKSKELTFVGYCESTKGYRLIDPQSKRLTISRDVIFIETDSSALEEPNKSEILVSFPEYDIEDDEIEPTENESSSEYENDERDQDNLLIADDSSERGDVDQLENRYDNVGGEASHSEFQSQDHQHQFQPQGEQDEARPPEELPQVQPSTGPVQVEPPHDEHQVPELRRSSRIPKPIIRQDFISFSASNATSDPDTFAEATNRPDAALWRQAMHEEFQSLQSNHTWDLVDLPPNRKAIKCKWVFKTKKDSTGNVVRYKARLVVKGCSQKPGIDFTETYSPVVRHSSIRLLLSLAAMHELNVDHLDVVTAFLNGNLDEEIYMQQPEGFSEPGISRKVCKLNKALYGLKQGSRAWNKKLDESLRKFGLRRCKTDQCTYYLPSSNEILIVAVYVDDLLILSSHIERKEKIKEHLAKVFQMKDLGEAKHILGMTITRDKEKKKIWLDQKGYIEEMLRKYNMQDANPVTVPMDPNQKLTKEMCPKTDEQVREMAKKPYQELVGSLMYACQGTRPDIAHALSVLSRFNDNPGKSHWIALKRVLRYLKGTADACLEFSSQGDGKLRGFCDADWANDPETRRSVTGYVFLHSMNLISWSSKRQLTVALSTTEAEYMALSTASQEALWLKSLLEELNQNTSIPVIIHCDNKGAIDLASNEGYRPRTKHIDLRHHFVREKIEEGKIALKHVGTIEMLADHLTKAVPKAKLEVCNKGIGLITKSAAFNS